MTQLDSVLEALGGADVQGGLADLIQSQGGVGNLLQQFQSSDLGDAAASWVSTGPNQMLGASQVSTVLGAGPVADFARRLGITPAQASAIAAVLIPLIISQLTPKGQAHEADANLNQAPGGLGGVLSDILGQARGGQASSGPAGADVLGQILGGALGGGGLGGGRGEAAPGGLGGLGDLLGGVLGRRR